MSHEAERTAVEQLFLKVTLPIIVQDKGRFGIVGTATLFTIQDRPFLVTAGHTILDYSVDRWAYSEHPTGGPICTLGALHHHRPKNERYDVAVVEILTDDELARRSKETLLALGFLRLGSGTQYDYGTASGDTIYGGGFQIGESGGKASGRDGQQRRHRAGPLRRYDRQHDSEQRFGTDNTTDEEIR